jgi:MFS family permease
MTTLRTDPRPGPAAAPARLLRSRDYLLWLGSDTSSALAAAVYGFAVPLLTLVVTGRPALAGLVAAAGAVGRAVGTLPGGVLADRHDRRTLMVVGGLLGAALTGLLTLCLVAGVLDFWWLLGANLAIGLRTGLFGSVSDAALPAVVDKSRLGTALSANQGRDAAITMGAGPASGAMMATGTVLPLLASTVGHLLSAVTALRIRADLRPRPDDVAEQPGPAAQDGSRVRAVLASAREGMVWLWGRPALRTSVLVGTLLNLGVNAAVATVVYSLQQDGVGLAAVGLVTTTIGVGMLAGAVVAPFLLGRFRTGPLVVGGLLLAVAAFVVLPFVEGVPATLAVIGIGILGAPAANAGLGGWFMAVVPSELRGRAGSAVDLLSMGALPLAPVVAGFGLTLIGLRGTLVVAAGICLVAALMLLADRRLRNLPGPDGWADAEA